MENTTDYLDRVYKKIQSKVEVDAKKQIKAIQDQVKAQISQDMGIALKNLVKMGAITADEAKKEGARFGVKNVSASRAKVIRPSTGSSGGSCYNSSGGNSC